MENHFNMTTFNTSSVSGLPSPLNPSPIDLTPYTSNQNENRPEGNEAPTTNSEEEEIQILEEVNNYYGPTYDLSEGPFMLSRMIREGKQEEEVGNLLGFAEAR